MTKAEVKKILNNFGKLTIGVVGDYMLDEYIFGDVSRISPEAPVPIVNVMRERYTAGGAANVVKNIAELGAKVKCFGVIGDDHNGARLSEVIDDPNVDTTTLVNIKSRPTTVKTRIIGGNQQLVRIDWENAKDVDIQDEVKILDKFAADINNLDAVILSDYAKGVLTKTLANEVIKLCNKAGKIVVVDPKPSHVDRYLGATCITPNRKELRECLGVDRDYDLIKAGRELKKKLKLANLLLTRSEEGMSLFVGTKVTNIPTVAKEVYDVSGAGDTVISVYTLGCALGIDQVEVAKIANTAAGIVVGKIGTSTVTKDEIVDFYGKIYNE